MHPRSSVYEKPELSAGGRGCCGVASQGKISTPWNRPITRIDHAGACGSFQKKTGNDQWNSTNPLKSVYTTPCPPLPPCSPLTRHTLGLTQDLETGPEKMLWDGDTLLALSPLPKALVYFALHPIPCLQGVGTTSKSLDTFKCFREQISTCYGCLHAVLLFVMFGGQLVVAAIPMRK